ncbi:hypothetical protein SAMN06265373_101652 [Shimia sagamensis]|uniref:Uncharacterized protein n=1 Tax=Shimia sagamensis TaxID=1566352 RepID=A0ABY1NCR9_9RHOB|nr:hypothetical protein SAMN06265373_101652 [Shimia sagamensis]
MCRRQPAATPDVISAFAITINVPINKTAGMKKADRNMYCSCRGIGVQITNTQGFLNLLVSNPLMG